MKKIFLALLVTGCIGAQNISTTSGISSNLLDGIPKGAEIILVEKDVSPGELFEEIFSILLSRGHRISRDDKERGYITTEGRDVGESTLQRMTIVITGNSIAQISTEWKPGTEAVSMASAVGGFTVQPEWAKARWENNRLGIAFAESFAIANEVKNGTIKFN